MTAGLRMTLRADAARLPVDGSVLTPDRLAGLDRGAAARLGIAMGAVRASLGDLFSIAGEAGEAIELEGDLSGFARLGADMTRGALRVRGPAGPCAGSGMSGGLLHIDGHAGERAGEGLQGGLLRIDGDAGDHLAAPLPGRPRGMNRGAVLVRGSAGAMAAMRMRRGTIVINGDAGPGAGCGMLAGSLFVLGRLGEGAGALMRRGTIVALRGAAPLPIFLDAGAASHPFLTLYFRQIEAAGLSLPPGVAGARFRRHVGDISDLGRGEILVPEEGA